MKITIDININDYKFAKCVTMLGNPKTKIHVIGIHLCRKIIKAVESKKVKK